MPELAAVPTVQSAAQTMEGNLSADERDLFHEIFRALRVIRYGSMTITVHDGHVVEIQKTERIRKASAKKA